MTRSQGCNPERDWLVMVMAGHPKMDRSGATGGDTALRMGRLPLLDDKTITLNLLGPGLLPCVLLLNLSRPRL